MIKFTLPLKLVGANAREHHMVRHRRVKAERKAAGYVLNALRSQLPVLPITVDLTRVSAGTLDQHDNLRMAFKGLVDQVAETYGLPDCDPAFTWAYHQRTGKAGEYAAEISISSRKA